MPCTQPPSPRIIQYVWFFILNFLYSMVLIGIGTAVDLAIFRLTSYSYLVVSKIGVGGHVCMSIKDPYTSSS